MFGRSAEIANQYLKKGSKVLLEGRLIFEQWTAKDGTKRNRHSLRVETMKMLANKNSTITPQKNIQNSTNTNTQNLEEIPEDFDVF